jgi:hypothetical protein
LEKLLPCTEDPPDWDMPDIIALGYLIGPTIGSALFSLTHPSLSKGNPAPLEVMDRAFYDHVKANRASPEFQSVNNPAPDFYGEKVSNYHADYDHRASDHSGMDPKLTPSRSFHCRRIGVG